MRLDKYLAEAGIGSRSQVKNILKKGQIAVNGQITKRPEEKVDPEKDQIFFQGEKIFYQENLYYLLNKPSGVITATEDKKEKTVLDLFPPHLQKKLFPVGRLDKDTVGLLLLTDDGELAHRLLSPKKQVAKVYEALVDGRMDETDQLAFQKGLDIGDEKPALPAVLKILKKGERSLVEITVTEGRFHQVKRMCRAVGKPVLALKRISMGTLRLDEALSEGAYRPLTEEEIRRIKEC